MNQEWISPRGAIARNLSDTCLFSELNPENGVQLRHCDDGWIFDFINGTVVVSSPKMITIKIGTAVNLFKSEYAARDFLFNLLMKHIRT